MLKLTNECVSVDLDERFPTRKRLVQSQDYPPMKWLKEGAKSRY